MLLRRRVRAAQRYGAILLMLAAAFTFAMVAPPGGWGHVVTALLQGGAALAALSRARPGRRLLAGWGVAASATTAVAVSAAFGGRYEGGLSDLAGAVLLGLVPAGIWLDLRRDLAVTVQSVMAALCIYVVLGMVFASVASAVAAIGGAAYFVGRPSADTSDYTYFSFITLATVGYGDYVPALRLGRALAVLEGLTGQLYLVTVVALVVGNLGRRRLTRPVKDLSSASRVESSAGGDGGQARGRRHPPGSPAGGPP
ncbi:MAG TPA: potassium channel family protein [Candidatus Eisenbacteria bacterium]|nr:potassium channel family protein [Candidatus Eisenbacteria bacterium]